MMDAWFAESFFLWAGGLVLVGTVVVLFFTAGE